MVRGFFLLLLFAWISFGLSGFVAVALADCTPSTRDINFSDGSARVKDYLCQVGNTSPPQIQVEYDRLSEPLASEIIHSIPDPDIAHGLGSDFIMFENDVFAQVKSLFETYGRNEDDATCYRFGVGVPPGGIPYLGNGTAQDPCGERRTLQFLTFPDRDIPNSLSLVLPNDQLAVRTSDHWPLGWKFFYYDCPAKSVIECTILWRSGKDSDISDYEDRVKQYESRLGLPENGAAGDAAAPEWTTTARHMIALVRHLSEGGWPQDFLIVTGSRPPCGSGIEFHLKIRQFVLEAALIKNVSAETLTINNLLGTTDTARSLRTMNDPAGDTNPVLPLQRMDLAPGKTLFVPTKILFVPAGGADEIFWQGIAYVPIDKTFAEEEYRTIATSPAGTAFKEATADGTPPLTKVSDSFGVPSVPVLPFFLYGPSVNLTGITLNDQALTFTGSERNFFHLVARDHPVSCP